MKVFTELWGYHSHKSADKTDRRFICCMPDGKRKGGTLEHAFTHYHMGTTYALHDSPDMEAFHFINKIN